jgi:hypothetical protein
MTKLLGAIKSALGRATLVPPGQWRKLLNSMALTCGSLAFDQLDLAISAKLTASFTQPGLGCLSTRGAIQQTKF